MQYTCLTGTPPGAAQRPLLRTVRGVRLRAARTRFQHTPVPLARRGGGGAHAETRVKGGVFFCSSMHSAPPPGHHILPHLPHAQKFSSHRPDAPPRPLPRSCFAACTAPRRVVHPVLSVRYSARTRFRILQSEVPLIHSSTSTTSPNPHRNADPQHPPTPAVSATFTFTSPIATFAHPPPPSLSLTPPPPNPSASDRYLTSLFHRLRDA